jgi:hypothetical protein
LPAPLPDEEELRDEFDVRVELFDLLFEPPFDELLPFAIKFCFKNYILLAKDLYRF